MNKETLHNLMIEVRAGIFENFQHYFNYEKIRHLNLYDFRKILAVDTHFLENIMKALKETPLITSIDLGNNDISSKESLTLLAELLPHTSITHLSLAENNIDDELACHFALALRKAHVNLEYLDLRNNFLEFKANKIPAFIQAFKKAPVRNINLESSFQSPEQDPIEKFQSLTFSDPFPITLSYSRLTQSPTQNSCSKDLWDWEPDDIDQPEEKSLKCS